MTRDERLHAVNVIAEMVTMNALVALWQLRKQQNGHHAHVEAWVYEVTHRCDSIVRQMLETARQAP